MSAQISLSAARHAPRAAGRAVEASRSCATVESGKWVGPAPGAEVAPKYEAKMAADNFKGCA